MTALIHCRDVRVRYGRQEVLHGVDLDLSEGEIVALLGPNGSGKSTLLNSIAGFVRTSGGRIEMFDRPVAFGRTDRFARLGMGIVDGRSLFMQMTVSDNLRLARADRRRGGAIDEVLAYFPSLGSLLGTPAGQLSGGEQQMLALARCLVRKPRLMLIDEISMGLAPQVVEHLFPLLRRIAADTGVGVLMVEQHVSLALEAAERGVLLVNGDLAAEGPSAQLLADGRRVLEDAYLGVSPTPASVGAISSVQHDGSGFQ